MGQKYVLRKKVLDHLVCTTNEMKPFTYEMGVFRAHVEQFWPL